MEQLILDFKDNGYPSFEFFLGESNQELVYVLKNKVSNLTYIWGDLGSGKSHLLKSWIQNAIDMKKEALYLTASNRQSFKLLRNGNFNFVAIDDIDSLNESEQIDVFNFFNKIRGDNNIFFLASASCPPQKLKIRNDLRTRLGLCLIYKVNILSDAEKIDALKKISKSRQIRIDDEVYKYLIERYYRDLNSLINVIFDLDEYSVKSQKKITIPLIKKYLFNRDNNI